MILGVDGCRGGWVGVALPAAGAVVVVGATVADVVAQVPGVEVVAVDIPIGLVDDGWRACDVLGRQALGQRACTLFLTPVRAALAAPTYEQANAASRAAMGAGVSTQAYALRRRVHEVDAWVRSEPGVAVHEAHPELSFAAMAGRVVTTTKHRPEGRAERRALLARHGIAVPAAVPGVPPADVLDAAACAWTARRIAAGTAERVGGADGPVIRV